MMSVLVGGVEREGLKRKAKGIDIAFGRIMQATANKKIEQYKRRKSNRKINMLWE